MKKIRFITISAMIFIVAISSSMFAIEGDAYASGRAVIKVTETNTSG